MRIMPHRNSWRNHLRGTRGFCKPYSTSRPRKKIARKTCLLPGASKLMGTYDSRG
jgi:hypothetical protein